MKNVLRTALLLSAIPLATSAYAADLGQPYTKAQAVTATSDWSGLYLGGSLGGRWSDANWTTTGIGIGGGGLMDPFSPSAAKFDPASVRVGGYFGYNWQLSPAWVVGLEGDFGWGNTKGAAAGIPGTYDDTQAAGARASDSISLKTDFDWSLRARAGYLITPNLLTYATGGAAFQQVDLNATCAGAHSLSWCSQPHNETFSKTMAGWTVGGGLEAKIASNWTVRGEYRCADFGKLTHTFFRNSPGGDDVAGNVKVRTQTATIGVSYLFGVR